MKIAVCAVAIGEEYNKKFWVRFAKENHIAYCNKHNYDYIIRTSQKTNRIANWEKVDLIKSTMLSNKYDYIFWMDQDSIFTNFNITLENIIKKAGQKYNFIFSGDTNIINTGHFIFKSCPWSLTELQNIWNIYPANYGMSGDNAAFSVWLGGGNGNMMHNEQLEYYELVDKGYTNAYEQKRIENGEATEYICKRLNQYCKLIPKKAINSYNRDFEKGDFIFHAVASGDSQRNNIFCCLQNQNLIIR
jgi:hypothetical protein